MIVKNFLKDKLSSSPCVLGTWSVIPSSVIADIIGSSHLDFLIIDLEHGPSSFETAQNMVISCEARQVSPIIRVGGVIEDQILRALETGAHCIQIPNIHERAQVELAVNICKYPPVGNRGFSPFTRAGGYSHTNAQKIFSQSNQSTMLTIQIEGSQALKNLDDILSVRETDIVFIGLYDLSKSLGHSGDVNHPEVIETLLKVVRKIKEHNKYAGTIVTDTEQMRFMVDLGINYITFSADCEIIYRGYKQIKENFEELLLSRKGQ